MNPIESLRELKAINVEYYTSLHTARQNGRWVAYVNAFTPVELLYAMDFVPVYPENHAVILGARRLTVEVAAAAEELGYSMDLCSYARCDMGSRITGKSPTMGLPRPDLLLVSNSQCGTMTKWFEVVARWYDAPMYLIDVPHSDTAEPDPQGREYVRSQLEELIGLLEDITGRPLDEERLKDVIRLSREASDLWREVLESAMHRPSPITVFDEFIAMSPIVSQRGTEVAVKFYRQLLDELHHRMKSATGSVDEERYRLFWDNLPIWPELRRLSSFLDSRGAALVASLYTWAWTNLAVGEDDPLGDWADQYLYTANLHINRRIEQYAEFAQRFQLDGFIYHSNRSCKMISQDIPEVKRALSEDHGMPGIIIEADHNDPRLYSPEALEAQIQSFLEFLESRKKTR
jgi:benzoyl-CoA reductase/2-hydroxyglutaryl-CoA dehydratase subunit BcrC/BadD/HgdB